MCSGEVQGLSERYKFPPLPSYETRFLQFPTSVDPIGGHGQREVDLQFQLHVLPCDLEVDQVGEVPKQQEIPSEERNISGKFEN